MTVTDHLRQHLLGSLGYAQPSRRMPSLDILRETEWSPRFAQLMRNRLVMGAFRYGRFGSSKKGGYDCLRAIACHAVVYRCTGNLEALVDIANLALVEFVESRHPLKHWTARDDSEHAPANEEGAR